ncbi:MAG: TRM11 family methyltransferase [Clostridiaceae bacterium]
MSIRLYRDKIPYVKNNCKSGCYLYTSNFPETERGLWEMEMKSLFGIQVESKEFISDIYINPSRSPFIKHRISVMFFGSTLEDILKKIKEARLSAEKYKVFYINTDSCTPGFHESRKIEYRLGEAILGEAEMETPSTVFGIAKAKDTWLFGYCESNSFHWQNHKRKPFSYSNSLNAEVSRAIVNIASPEISGAKLIDPCCGVGTVLVEALDQGIDIEGWEINPMIGANAKANLKYFGLKDVITIGDMKSIKKHYDTAILDLPYGLFTSTTFDEQRELISHTRKIADRMVIITFENMEKPIKDCGFRIIDTCTVSKGKFKRFISLCI